MSKPATQPPGGNSGSLVEVAYARLRAAIEAHDFEPGQRMLEAEIAEWLGISRTPTRDALRLLEADGLLAAAPRRGLVVATLDHRAVSEIYDVRTALESFAASRAARQASSAEVAMLRGNLRKQEEADQDDIPLLLQLNAQFHEILVHTSRNRYLQASLHALEAPLAVRPGTTHPDPHRPQEAPHQHRAIVDAIASGDADAAHDLAADHVRTAEQIRLVNLADSD